MSAALTSEWERPREWPNSWAAVCRRLVPLKESMVQYSFTVNGEQMVSVECLMGKLTGKLQNIRKSKVRTCYFRVKL